MRTNGWGTVGGGQKRSERKELSLQRGGGDSSAIQDRAWTWSLVALKHTTHSGAVLKREKKVFLNGSFAKRPRVAHMFNHGWWRLAVGHWRLVAVSGGCRRLVIGG